MARPEEKAQAMLNKWIKMREDHNKETTGLSLGRRPYLASMCEHKNDAEKYRRDILREISNGVRDIQNPGLGEHGVRDLNDKINKLLREKWHWNKRILELGGPNYNQIERRRQIEESDDQAGLQGSGGYRYFGEARNLPGVKEMFARHAARAVAKRRRGDLHKHITPDYFGLRDEEDGVLLELEAEHERTRARKVRTPTEDDDDDDDEEARFAADGDAVAAHLAIPTQEIVEQVVLERKKHELLNNLTF